LGLTEFAEEQQVRFQDVTDEATRREYGHFSTPAAVAHRMANMFGTLPSGKVSLLDAGAGVGILTAAVCERLIRLKKPRDVYVECWETCENAVQLLHETLDHVANELKSVGHRFEYKVRSEDFVLEHGRPTLFGKSSSPRFNLAIINPPYFKIRKDSQHAKAMPHVVHGQPNIYALFMAAAADLLQEKGKLVAITPRSYFNGPYFRKFRDYFLGHVSPNWIHQFESRSETFKKDSVLQESVIVAFNRGVKTPTVRLTGTLSSASNGKEVERVVPASHVLKDYDGDTVIRLTADAEEDDLLTHLDSLPQTFGSLGLRVSTGPVVSFRATQHLVSERNGHETAPLLWLHNVRPFRTVRNGTNSKPSHIAVSDSSRSILLRTRRYVLLKRFTAKEENRRLVAGVFTPDDSYSDWVGLENHLNYVYFPDRELSESQSLGIAAVFNSTLYDKYFRAVSGNTQVNAQEIRSMPLPSMDVIERIGEELAKCPEIDQEVAERLVRDTLTDPSVTGANP